MTIVFLCDVCYVKQRTVPGNRENALDVNWILSDAWQCLEHNCPDTSSVLAALIVPLLQ